MHLKERKTVLGWEVREGSKEEMTLGVDFKGYGDDCAKQRRVREGFQTRG